MRPIALLACLLLAWLAPLHAATLARVEPANWWVGMRHSEVELMLHGRDIAALQARTTHPGVRVLGTAALDSPNYLFVTVAIDALQARIHEAMAPPARLPDGTLVETSVSIGAAVTQPGLSAEEVLAAADAAMYVAKRRRGR